MPSSRISAAYARDAAQRHADYRNPVRIGGAEGYGIYPAARFERDLVEGVNLMTPDNEASLRLLKSEWTGYTAAAQFEGVTIELWLNGAWVALDIGPVTDSHLTGEWKLALRGQL